MILFTSETSKYCYWDLWSLSQPITSFYYRTIQWKNVHYNTRSNVPIEIGNGKNIHCKKASFKTPKVKTIRFGIETTICMGPIIWISIPEETKNAQSLDIFKKQVKRLTFDKCKICKVYIQGFGRALAFSITFFL